MEGVLSKIRDVERVQAGVKGVQRVQKTPLLVWDTTTGKNCENLGAFE